MQEWVLIYETNECDIGTLDSHRFLRLTGCQLDPGIGVSQQGFRAKVNDYLRSSVCVYK